MLFPNQRRYASRVAIGFVSVVLTDRRGIPERGPQVFAMTQITVSLPEDIVERGKRLAERSGRPVEDLLAETIELSFRPLGTLSNGDRPTTDWSDEEVLAAVETELPPADDARLGDLLDCQQAGPLAPADRAELAVLLESYQSGLLRKAQALREAVSRGLREPLKLPAGIRHAVVKPLTTTTE